MEYNFNCHYQPNFKALHIANADKIKLYKIVDEADKKFIKKLPELIDTKKLMPDLDKITAARWNEMLEYAVNNALIKGNETYIAACENKPCGIITWQTGKNVKLDCICTWPIEVGKKVKLAGKTLFYQFFKDFLEQNCKKAELEAITNGPYNTIQKYEQLGFSKTSKVYPTKVVMETSANKIKETFEKLKRVINYEDIEPQKIKLANIFNMQIK